MTPQHDGHQGHDGHHDHAAVFGRLLWIMTLIAVPTVAASGTVAGLFGYQVPGALAWLAPVGGTVLFVWGGNPFYTGALTELRDRQPGMMLLITTGITVAFAASWAATLGLVDTDLEFWWELALLVVVMLLGHWVEMRSLARSSSALESLAELLPEQAERVAGEHVVRVPPDELATDDIVVGRPGSRVPADGEVVSGSAAVDESMLTGESTPVQRETGARVVAGSIATGSALRVRVTAVGEETALAGIRRLVAQAQESSSRAQRLADRAAALLFW